MRRQLSVLGLGGAAALLLVPSQCFAQATPHLKLTATGISAIFSVDYVSGLGSASPVVERNTPTGVMKDPGTPVAFMDLTISRPFKDNLLLQWRKDVIARRPGFKKTVQIQVLDKFQVPVAQFDLVNAWPSVYSVSSSGLPPGPKTAPVETETITFVCEGFTRTQ